ncbi:MAG: hypothetical protein H6741_04515 [Alphaproteobacteria bacterium]|nr:hypothetical protein [Alphaproteobacteria bacterium]
MPVGKWKRFKLAFLTGREDQKTAWDGIVKATLRKLEDAAKTLATVNATRSQELLVEHGKLVKAVELAQGEYSKATTDGDKDAQITKINQANRTAEGLLTEAHGLLKALQPTGIVNLPGGLQILDDMMDEVDWSANQNSDETFGLAALKARFNISKVTGDLGHIALPKLYYILSRLPDGHTRTNDHLDKVKREKPLLEMGGLYNVTDKEIVISTRASDGLMARDWDTDVDDDVAEAHQLQGVAVKGFSHVTLHEVGHAYDHSQNFMGSRAGQADYGGWHVITRKQLADAWANEKGFYAEAAFSSIPRSFLQSYLVTELEKGDRGASARAEWAKLTAKGRLAPDEATVRAHGPIQQAIALYRQYEDPNDAEHVWPEEESDRKVIAERLVTASHSDTRTSGLSKEEKPAYGGVQQPAIRFILIDKMAPDAAIAKAIRDVTIYVDVQPDWSALKRHAAAQIMREYHGMKKGGLWKKGASGAARYAIGGVVYTVDKDLEPSTYMLAARAFSVSKYQWNAPAEWFAELYAYYFAGRMKPSAKHVKLFLSELGEPFPV